MVTYSGLSAAPPLTPKSPRSGHSKCVGHQPPSPATGHGTLRPPLLSHTPGSSRTGSVGSGSRLAMAKASISNCTSSGTLRSSST
jgi:hypothetical protein